MTNSLFSSAELFLRNIAVYCPIRLRLILRAKYRCISLAMTYLDGPDEESITNYSRFRREVYIFVLTQGEKNNQFYVSCQRQLLKESKLPPVAIVQLLDSVDFSK